MLDISTGQSVSIDQTHESPIKSLEWMSTSNAQCLVSASWDKNLKYWDTRTGQSVACLKLPERAYCTSVSGNLLVVGCAERNIVIIDLNNPTSIYKALFEQSNFR